MIGILAGLGSMFFWGGAIFLAGLATRKIKNLQVLFWMQVFGFLVGSIYFFLNLNSFAYNQIPSFVPLLIIIALLQVIAYLAFYRGLQKGQVSIVSPIGASWGMITTILSVVFYHEGLKFTQVIAIALIFLSVIIVSVDLKSLLNKKLEVLAGVKEAIIAMFAWGISLFLIVPAVNQLGWFLPAYIFRLFALIFLVAYIVATKEKFITQLSTFPFKILIFTGIFDMIAFMAYSYGVSGAYASIVAPIGGANTLVTIILATIFLKEKLNPNQILGILGIIIGLLLISI